jgi:hypothetical protein
LTLYLFGIAKARAEESREAILSPPSVLAKIANVADAVAAILLIIHPISRSGSAVARSLVPSERATIAP